MTVQDIIDQLTKLDPTAQVFVAQWDGLQTMQFDLGLIATHPDGRVRIGICDAPMMGDAGSYRAPDTVNY